MGVNASRTAFCSMGSSVVTVAVGEFKLEHPVLQTDRYIYVAGPFLTQP
jgi:hypothetical protein